MSYRKLAEMLNLSPSHICRVINGRRQSRRLVAELKKMRHQVPQGHLI